MNKKSSNKQILIKPLIEIRFEDCEEDKENQCQTFNSSIHWSQKRQIDDKFVSKRKGKENKENQGQISPISSHLTQQIQINDKFVSKRKRMRSEKACSDLAQATPHEEAILQAVKQPIKSCINITRIPREKSVNVVSNKPIDFRRNEPDQKLLRKSDDLNKIMDDNFLLDIQLLFDESKPGKSRRLVTLKQPKYVFSETSDNMSDTDEDKPKSVFKTRKTVKSNPASTKKPRKPGKTVKRGKNSNDEPPPKRSSRIAALKRPNYVVSGAENSDYMSDIDEKSKRIYKPKTAIKSRNQATKKRSITNYEKELNLSSAQNDQADLSYDDYYYY